MKILKKTLKFACNVSCLLILVIVFGLVILYLDLTTKEPLF